MDVLSKPARYNLTHMYKADFDGFMHLMAVGVGTLPINSPWNTETMSGSDFSSSSWPPGYGTGRVGAHHVRPAKAHFWGMLYYAVLTCGK